MEDKEAEELPSVDLLQALETHAKSQVEYQIQEFHDVNNKSFRILRLSLLILGALAGAVPVAVQLEIPVGKFINLYSIFGMFSLFGSILAAAATYFVTTYSYGISPQVYSSVIDTAIDLEDYYIMLIRGYKHAISENSHTLRVQSKIFSACIWIFIISLIYLCAGYIAAIYSPAIGERWQFFALLTGAIIIVVRFVRVKVQTILLSSHYVNRNGEIDPSRLP